MSPYITDIFAVLGALYAVATALATTLPKSKVQAFFAKIAADLTNLQSEENEVETLDGYVSKL